MAEDKVIKNLETQEKSLGSSVANMQLEQAGVLAKLKGQLQGLETNLYNVQENQLLADFNLRSTSGGNVTGLLQTLNRFNFETDKLNLDRQRFLREGEAKLGFDLRGLDRQLQQTDIRESLYDLNTKSRLEDIETAQGTLRYSIAGDQTRVQGSREVLAGLGRIEDLIKAQSPLVKQQERLALTTSQITEESLMNRRREALFNRSVQSQSTLLGREISGGAGGVLYGSLNFGQGVGFGRQLGQILGQIDQANVQQQQIVVDTKLRLNKIQQNLENNRIQQTRVKTQIKTLLNSISQKRYRIQRFDEKKGLIKDIQSKTKELFDLSRDSIKDRKKRLEEINMIAKEFMEKEFKINESFLQTGLVLNLQDFSQKASLLNEKFAITSGFNFKREQMIRQNIADLRGRADLVRSVFSRSIVTARHRRARVSDRLRRIKETQGQSTILNRVVI